MLEGHDLNLSAVLHSRMTTSGNQGRINAPETNIESGVLYLQTMNARQQLVDRLCLAQLTLTSNTHILCRYELHCDLTAITIETSVEVRLDGIINDSGWLRRNYMKHVAYLKLYTQ